MCWWPDGDRRLHRQRLGVPGRHQPQRQRPPGHRHRGGGRGDPDDPVHRAGGAGRAPGLRLLDVGAAVRPADRDHARPDRAGRPGGAGTLGAAHRAGIGRGRRGAGDRDRAHHRRLPRAVDERRTQSGVSVLYDPDRGAGVMSLPAPDLDDRRFQDIVDEAKRRINRLCPEWTDHNVSDPGVALIELFAWMTEMTLYRVNQIPDRLYVKFLELVGVELFSAAPARTDVLFTLAAPTPEPVRVPAGTQVGTER